MHVKKFLEADSRTKIGFILLALLLLASVFIWIDFRRNARLPDVSCFHYATGVYAPQSLKDLTKKPVIFTAKLEKVRGSGSIDVSLREQLKGKIKSKTIRLCAVGVDPSKLVEGKNLVVFIEGQDSRRSNTLVPAYDGVGLEQDDGRFSIRQDEGQNSSSLEEIRRAIHEE